MKVVHFYPHFKAWIFLQFILLLWTTSLAISTLHATIGWNTNEKFQNKPKQHKLSSQKNLQRARDFLLQSWPTWGLGEALKFCICSHMTPKENLIINLGKVYYLMELESIWMWPLYVFFLHFPLLSSLLKWCLSMK